MQAGQPRATAMLSMGVSKSEPGDTHKRVWGGAHNGHSNWIEVALEYFPPFRLLSTLELIEAVHTMELTRLSGAQPIADLVHTKLSFLDIDGSSAGCAFVVLT